jgi:ADP-ribose pyrophosphatase
LSFRLTRKRRTFQGRTFTVEVQEWRGPDGKRFWRDCVVHPGAVAILAFASSTKVLVLRQWRAAARRWLLELPAGTLERGEKPLGCARRELVEETGFGAKRWQRLGGIFTAPGFCTEYIHLFAARNLVPRERALDDDEHIEVVPMTLLQLTTAVRRGQVEDAKSLSALCCWLLQDRKRR